MGQNKTYTSFPRKGGFKLHSSSLFIDNSDKWKKYIFNCMVLHPDYSKLGKKIEMQQKTSPKTKLLHMYKKTKVIKLLHVGCQLALILQELCFQFEHIIKWQFTGLLNITFMLKIWFFWSILETANMNNVKIVQKCPGRWI